MAETTAKFETGTSRLENASDRAQDYLERDTESASGRPPR